MPDPLATFPILFAQNQPAGNAGSGSPFSFLPFILVIVVWGYFLLIRPQQQQEKKRRELLSALKKNDKVLTTSGMYATVVSVDADADRVVLRVDDDKGVKVAFSKSAVVRIIDNSQEKAAESA